MYYFDRYVNEVNLLHNIFLKIFQKDINTFFHNSIYMYIRTWLYISWERSTKTEFYRSPIQWQIDLIEMKSATMLYT